jgi:hypothetical protein
MHAFLVEPHRPLNVPSVQLGEREVPREVATVAQLSRGAIEPSVEECCSGIVIADLKQDMRRGMSAVATSGLQGVRPLRQSQPLRAVSHRSRHGQRRKYLAHEIIGCGGVALHSGGQRVDVPTFASRR